MSVKTLFEGTFLKPIGFKADKVIVVLLLALLILGLIDLNQAVSSLKFIANAIISILPFFLLAVSLAAAIKASGTDKIVANVFSGHPLKAVFIASVFGALSPFCSCGVIPLIASLLAAGVPLAPVMSFWIASPVMDPEMFILTAAGIGFDFAVAKAGFAIALGLFAGISVLLIQRTGLLQNVLLHQQSSNCASTCNSAEDDSVLFKFWNDSARMAEFKDEFISISLFLGKWLALAFFIESLMVAFINPEWVQTYIGGDEAYVIPLAALIGMPSYLNGYAAIPLVGGLIDMGMSAGAAMAFMLTGAVSSIPAAIAVYALVRKQVFVFYLLIGLSGSIIFGYVYQSFIG